CEDVNQRLRRCEEFLQRGLRTEAIQFAQVEPPLLDILAVLDFPERSRWAELSLASSLPQVQRLRIESAEALNKAFAEEKALERIAGGLHSAFGSQDAVSARRLRDDWNRQIQEGSQPADDPDFARLCHKVSPALKWLAQLDRQLADEDACRKVLEDFTLALD